MEISPLGIAGAFVVTPRLVRDERGVFLESFRADLLTERFAHGMRVAQANVSVSGRGVVRGIHFADVPPGQAKYVTCLTGAILDVVVDVRPGSPTFAQWEAVRLDPVERRAVFLAEGLGHAFMALEEDTSVHYLCSTTYNPTAEHAVHPLDPAIGIAWPDGVEPRLSPKDADAPTLAQALRAGILPSI